MFWEKQSPSKKEINITEIEKFVFTWLDPMNAFHTRKCREYGAILAEQEKADKTVVDVALMFHDLAKSPSYNASLMEHAKAGADLARKFLQEKKYSQEFIDKVCHCVEAHSSPWAKNAPMPESKEAKVVYDADTLHQLTNWGIVKQAYINASLPWKEMLIQANQSFLTNLKTMQTRSGKRMAKESYEKVKEFMSKVE